MRRYTRIGPNGGYEIPMKGDNYYSVFRAGQGECIGGDAVRRLAAYEDTGLTPEDVARVVRERDAAVEDLNELGGDAESCLVCRGVDCDGWCDERLSTVGEKHCWQWRGVREGGAGDVD